MALIPTTDDSPTVSAIYAAYVRNNKARRSRRLGASEIGKACDRRIWYGFRWYGQEDFDGRMLRLFETGHLEEPRIANNLRAIGCEVHLDSGETQFTFTDISGHFVDKIDGAVLGLPEAPKTWHCLEIKTHNAKSFGKLKTLGVRAHKPDHYCQLITGMALSKMKRGLYIAVNKDTDELYSERFRIEECKDDVAAILKRAASIIFSPVPPERISRKADSTECRYCPFNAICHEDAEPDKTCRSCKHSMPFAPDTEPVEGEDLPGDWVCHEHCKTLTKEEQEAGCELYQIILDNPLVRRGGNPCPV